MTLSSHQNSNSTDLGLSANVQWVVVCDAVGTVIHPEPAVANAYHAHGQRHGSSLGLAEIKRRFSAGRKNVFGVRLASDIAASGSRDYLKQHVQLPSSNRSEREMWKRLVVEIFDDVDDTDALFTDLWDHFAEAENWRAFEDVGPCVAALKKMGVLVVIASNFDSRLLDFAGQIEGLRDFDHVFCSSEIGFRKPDVRFYDTVEAYLRAQDQSRPFRFCMVGDDLEHDCLAPQSLGWDAVCLDRSGKIEPKYQPLSGLVCLPEWFEARLSADKK